VRVDVAERCRDVVSPSRSAAARHLTRARADRRGRGEDGGADRRALREEGFLADVAITGADALWMATTVRYDAIVLDAFDELCARLRALIRRGAGQKPTVLTAGDLRLDPAAHRACRGDSELSLTAKEFTVFEAFMHGRARR
jgi:DNA-binding response OmpR family regulator